MKGNINISENDIDPTQRTGKAYADNMNKKQSKPIILRFTSFPKYKLIYCRKKTKRCQIQGWFNKKETHSSCKS